MNMQACKQASAAPHSSPLPCDHPTTTTQDHLPHCAHADKDGQAFQHTEGTEMSRNAHVLKTSVDTDDCIHHPIRTPVGLNLATQSEVPGTRHALAMDCSSKHAREARATAIPSTAMLTQLNCMGKDPTAVVAAAAMAAAPAAANNIPTLATAPARRRASAAMSAFGRPAVTIPPSLSACVSAELAVELSLFPGPVDLMVMVEDEEQQQPNWHPAGKTLMRRNNGPGLMMSLRKSLSLAEGLNHRGWQRFEDGRLVMILSKSNSIRMTLDECLVPPTSCTHHRQSPKDPSEQLLLNQAPTHGSPSEVGTGEGLVELHTAVGSCTLSGPMSDVGSIRNGRNLAQRDPMRGLSACKRPRQPAAALRCVAANKDGVCKDCGEGSTGSGDSDWDDGESDQGDSSERGKDVTPDLSCGMQAFPEPLHMLPCKPVASHPGHSNQQSACRSEDEMDFSDGEDEEYLNLLGSCSQHKDQPDCVSQGKHARCSVHGRFTAVAMDLECKQGQNRGRGLEAREGEMHRGGGKDDGRLEHSLRVDKRRTEGTSLAQTVLGHSHPMGLSTAAAVAGLATYAVAQGPVGTAVLEHAMTAAATVQASDPACKACDQPAPESRLTDCGSMTVGPQRTSVRLCRNEAGSMMYCLLDLFVAAGWDRAAAKNVRIWLGAVVCTGRALPLHNFICLAQHGRDRMGRRNTQGFVSANVAIDYFKCYAEHAAYGLHVKERKSLATEFVEVLRRFNTEDATHMQEPLHTRIDISARHSNRVQIPDKTLTVVRSTQADREKQQLGGKSPQASETDPGSDCCETDDEVLAHRLTLVKRRAQPKQRETSFLRPLQKQQLNSTAQIDADASDAAAPPAARPAAAAVAQSPACAPAAATATVTAVTNLQEPDQQNAFKDFGTIGMGPQRTLVRTCRSESDTPMYYLRDLFVASAGWDAKSARNAKKQLGGVLYQGSALPLRSRVCSARYHCDGDRSKRDFCTVGVAIDYFECYVTHVTNRSPQVNERKRLAAAFVQELKALDSQDKPGQPLARANSDCRGDICGMNVDQQPPTQTRQEAVARGVNDSTVKQLALSSAAKGKRVRFSDVNHQPTDLSDGSDAARRLHKQSRASEQGAGGTVHTCRALANSGGSVSAKPQSSTPATADVLRSIPWAALSPTTQHAKSSACVVGSDVQAVVGSQIHTQAGFLPPATAVQTAAIPLEKPPLPKTDFGDDERLKKHTLYKAVTCVLGCLSPPQGLNTAVMRKLKGLSAEVISLFLDTTYQYLSDRYLVDDKKAMLVVMTELADGII